MVKKISFNVVFASDEDPLFPSSELNTHGPTVHGWRSSPGSNISPHDIILRFHTPAKICRIQLLAHQYLIPEKIELWLHNSSNSMASTPSSQCFNFLGFVSLSDNSATNNKSRELQSVSVNPRRGTHLKLRLHQAHRNDSNINGQIALIAVNVLGEEVSENTILSEDGEVEYQNDNKSDLNIVAPNSNPELPLASVCDDLLFSMYVEESIADIIREMEEKKTKAVQDERFEYAKKLKLCMSALRSAGERLGRYALAKRQAVQQEDFTTAKLRKEQIEIYKSLVLKHLLVNDLLEANGPVPSNDISIRIYGSKPSLPPAPSLQDVVHALSDVHINESRGLKSKQDERSSTDRENYVGSVSVMQNESLSEHLALIIKKSHDELPLSPKMGDGRSPSRHSSPMSSRHSSLKRRNRSVPRNSYEDYEERTIPTLRQ